MKQIRLDNYHEYVVSDVAYEQIVAIVEASEVCKGCSKPFTKENPKVAEHTCLSCLLKREANKHLHFVGLVSATQYGDTYSFVDPKGYIYLSYSTSDKVELSHCQTIKHWGFPVPAILQHGEKEHQLDPYYWYIYGDFTKNAVIVIDYHESYGEHLHVAFIVGKHGSIVEINRRKGDIQKLFKRAREKAEATKDASGAYHLADGITTYQLYDSNLYSIISDLLSAEREPGK